jgi:hypothetical protein
LSWLEHDARGIVGEAGNWKRATFCDTAIHFEEGRSATYKQLKSLTIKKPGCFARLLVLAL